MKPHPEDGKASVKNIKDYLHLYLGCEVQYVEYYNTVIKNGILVEMPIGGTEWGVVNEQGDREYSFEQEIKPILRPLSDMTEDENKETSKLYFDFMEKQRPSTRDITMMAHMTTWFLSKYFDLFGLIESGLAIDKTKLNTHV